MVSRVLFYLGVHMFVCVLYQTPMNSLGSREILKYKYSQQSMLDIPLVASAFPLCTYQQPW